MECAQGPPTLHQRCPPGTSACSPPSRAEHEAEASTTGGSSALQHGLWLLGRSPVLAPTTHRQPWARWFPPRLGKHGWPWGKTRLWQKPKSPHTSEGFFSFCRDQVDLVFGILEHLEADVV